MKIGFYAPLKSPDHPVPSGDRRMARLLRHDPGGKWPQGNGHFLVKELGRQGNSKEQEKIQRQAVFEIARIHDEGLAVGMDLISSITCITRHRTG